MKKPIQLVFLAAVSLPIASVAATAPSTVIYTANLNLKQVSHHLLPASQASTAPHPFYKKFCATQQSVDYVNASGKAVLQYMPKTGMVKYAIAYQRLSGVPIMAHFHIGKMGVGGPIV